MFTYTIKSALITRYISNYDNNVIKNVLMAILNIDMWILMNVGQLSRKIIRILKPIIEILFIMGIGAGLLIFYGLIYMPNNNNNDFINEKLNLPKSKVLEIADATTTNYHTTFIERELNHLKNKAFNLELTLNKINLRLQSACKYGRILDNSLPDFASEAAGGSVIDTPNTESFHQLNQFQTLFGIPIWRPNYFTPRKIIQPWTQAGECWAFRGSNGNMEIELAHMAILDRITLEHIPLSASLSGTINSAPKEFRLLGKFRNKYFQLGDFIYNNNGPVSQIFEITNEEMKNVPFKIVMFQVLSNWGNHEYTCIYRIKVHGKIYDHHN